MKQNTISQPPVLSGKTVLASYLLTILDAAIQAEPGLQPDSLLKLAGIDPGILHSPDSRIPLEYSDRLWQVALEQSGDPCLGLHVGEMVRPGSFNVIGQLLMTCPSLEAALDNAIRHVGFIGEGTLLDRRYMPGKIALVWQAINPDWALKDHRLDATVTAALIFARWISGLRIIPDAVFLERPAPADWREYQRIFGCSVTFDARENALVLHEESLALPPREANESLHAILRDHVNDLQQDLQNIDMILYRLRQILQMTILQGDDPVIDNIAPKLNLSPRSLQRRLREHDTGFRQELATIRQEMASYWLQSTSLPLTEIAERLGFAELSVFSRAFKTWTGHAPIDFRRSKT